MWNRVDQMTTDIFRTINAMDSQQWIIASVVALGLGAIFLRGFGSRTNY